MKGSPIKEEKPANRLVMKPLSRFLALFIALALTFPNPALALRQTGLEESPEQRERLAQALRTEPVRTQSPVASGGIFPRGRISAPVTPPAAGAEEGEGIEVVEDYPGEVDSWQEALTKARSYLSPVHIDHLLRDLVYEELGQRRLDPGVLAVLHRGETTCFIKAISLERFRQGETTGGVNINLTSTVSAHYWDILRSLDQELPHLFQEGSRFHLLKAKETMELPGWEGIFPGGRINYRSVVIVVLKPGEQYTGLEERILTLPKGAKTARSVAFGPDNKSILVAHEKGGSLWRDFGSDFPTAEDFSLGLGVDSVAFLTGWQTIGVGYGNGAISLLLFPFTEQKKRFVTTAESRNPYGSMPVGGGEDAFPMSTGARVVFSPDGKFVFLARRYMAAVDRGSSGMVSRYLEHLELVGVGPTKEEDRTLWFRTNGPKGSLRQLPHGGYTGSIGLSSDGKKVAYGTREGKIIVVAIETERETGEGIGEDIKELVGHAGMVHSVAFSSDGNKILSGGADGSIRIWDSDGGRLHMLMGHGGAVGRVAFSSDGKRIVSGGADKTVRLWDSETGRVLKIFSGHEGPVFSVAFSPDGQRIASGGQDGTVRLWDISKVFSTAGAEEGGMGVARQELFGFVGMPVVRETLKTLAGTRSGPEEVLNLPRYFPGAMSPVRLQRAGFRRGVAQMVPESVGSYSAASAGMLTKALTVYVEEGAEWAAAVKAQLRDAAERGLITLLDAPQANVAQVVIAGRDIRADRDKQVLIQVSAEAAKHVTPGLLGHLEKEGLLTAGSVILLFKGDLDEEVLIFA